MLQSPQLILSILRRASTNEQSLPEITSQSAMESSTELLHHHQFPPPTFSRLPPDGDEFPNNCWSDEKLVKQGNPKKPFSTDPSSPGGSPPPLPTSEPPKEFPDPSPPPVPPKKKMATRACSFDERRKLFEPVTPATEEPSKRSVRDKIAMFSSRSSSSEDAPESPIFPKQGPLNLSSSSLSKPAGNSNGMSRSSEILLNTAGRKGSLDLTSLPGPVPLSKPTASLYGTLNRNTKTAAPSTESNLYERSQSMVDVVGENNNNYNRNVPSYQTSTLQINGNNASGRPLSSMMEQRRKCMTKLRGLVIPDGPEGGSKTSTSVVDLPTIISKDAVLPPIHSSSKPSLYHPPSTTNMSRTPLSRTESLDRFGPALHQEINQSAKLNGNMTLNNQSSEPFPCVLPKYSPAFKRRGLSAYQPASLSTSILPSKFTPTSANNAKSNANITNTNNICKSAPESTGLESLASPRSDSSYEYSTKKSSVESQKAGVDSPVMVKVEKEERKMSNGKSGKLEDSDNDSAVSSSRSSISHGLSPPNSPTPGDSNTATPDPDLGRSSEEQQMQEEQAMNLDESWRVLKPSSVEAINRKNVLKSAKFSSGGGDDSSVSSGAGKGRRSDDEEGSYADGETEDTESSCSELETGGNSRRHIVAGRISLNDRRDSKADTEDDEEDSGREKSAVNMEFTELTESPLQAIYDMEVKMAYINEVCDALNDRGRTELSRYFSRRDSEATVIERPIESKRKSSMDAVDGSGSSSSTSERRARNRSSSGNESDFSSNVSVGSGQNGHKSLSREPSSGQSTTTDSERWTLLEKKYSRSMTSVNTAGVAAKSEPQSIPQGLTPATSVPKIVTTTSEVVEKRIEKIIEKTSTDSTLKKTNPNIPRGRNDFRSIAEKWQKIEKSTDSTTTSKSEVPSHNLLEASSSSTTKSLSSSQTSSSTSSSNSISPSPSKSYANLLDSSKVPEEPITPPRTSSTLKPTKMEAMDPTDRTWADKRKSEGEARKSAGGSAGSSSTKRSVSVNDIRRAFEKAEIAVNAYQGGEERSPSESPGKKELTLPSAHFRVSSFDSTTSEESSAATPAGLYGSSNSLVSSAPRDPYGSITSLASSTSLISPQELQQLIDEANQSLEEAGTPSHEVSVVILHREFAGGSIGLTLAGGADYETKEITVHKVLNASIADRDGRIHRGDRILSINGKSTRGLTHREALNLLKSPRTEVVLVISRGRSGSNGFQTIEETSALDRAVEPLLNGNLVIENDDDTCYKWGPLKTVTLVKDGAGLGFSLEGGKGSILGDKPLTVKKIFIGGPAEKCGELKVGDLIVSINGTNVSSKSRTEAWNFMKKLSDGDVKIAIRSPLA